MKHAQREWGSLYEVVSAFMMIMLYIWWLRLSDTWTWVLILVPIVASNFVHREGPQRLGLWWSQFRAAAFPVLAWTAVVAAAVLATAALAGSFRRGTARQALVNVVWYVLWGLVQQYLLNGFFVNRLAAFAEPPTKPGTPCSEAPRARALSSARPGAANGAFAHRVALAAAALFSVVHLPNWFLMLATFVGGYVCARVYLRFRSLYALAIAHGVIGFVLFLAVPDSVSAHFLVGPRYVIQRYRSYPEFLL